MRRCATFMIGHQGCWSTLLKQLFLGRLTFTTAMCGLFEFAARQGSERWSRPTARPLSHAVVRSPLPKELPQLARSAVQLWTHLATQINDSLPGTGWPIATSLIMRDRFRLCLDNTTGPASRSEKGGDVWEA